MDEKKFKEKLVEFLVELGKPKRYEVGFVQGNIVINNGLNILGLNAIDILGFAKSANDSRIRKSKGAQAWFKKMYEDGWKYVANFEQEGLLTNGFIVMEKELPNKILDVIREELEALLRSDKDILQTSPLSPMTFIPKTERKISIVAEDVPKELMEMREEYIHKIVEVNPDKLQTVTFEKPGDLRKAILKTREPREGFNSEVNDFIIDAQKEKKTKEVLFFEETGKNAIWRGKETKAFKSWKEILN